MRTDWSEGKDLPLRTFHNHREAIQEIQTTDTPFKIPKDFSPESYFENSFGIIKDEDTKPCSVKIKVSEKQHKYLQTLPLHSSQQEIETMDEYSVFSCHIAPTADFKMELLSYGSEIEVLFPDWFRSDIAKKTQHITFRSGNALGADFFFTQGVTAVNQQRMQVVTPYSGHRKKTNYAYETVSLDNVNLITEPKVIYQSKSHKQTEPLIDKYLAGERDQYAMKAAYIIRDTVKVTGLKGSLPPATFVFFYINLTDPESGGTGHTKQVCRMNGVPFVNQKVWFKWLENDGKQNRD